MVRDHHIKGYSQAHKDEIVPYCRSCDRKAHDNARREGKCKLTHTESHRLSLRSCLRRSIKEKPFWTTIAPNIRLYEQIRINLNTGHIYIRSGFLGDHNQHIKRIKEKE